MGAMGVIADARLGSPLNIIAFLIYVICASLLLLIPIVVFAMSPAKSATTLEAAGKWLEAHNRVIVIAISVIFGTFFLAYFVGDGGLHFFDSLDSSQSFASWRSRSSQSLRGATPRRCSRFGL